MLREHKFISCLDCRLVRFWQFGAAFRFFLKTVKDVYCILNSQSVNSAESIAVKIRHDFHDRYAGESMQGLGQWRLIAALSLIERMSHNPPNFIGKRPKIFF